MAKKAEGTDEGEAMYEVGAFRDLAGPAVYAGVCEQEDWRPNKMVTRAEFERAAERFKKA